MEDQSSERWKAAILNLSEMNTNLDSLQKTLLKKAVFLDQETFSKASLCSDQARTIKALEQRVENLERELDNAITAAARARSEKRQAEAAQRAAELHALEVTRELENTSSMYLDILACDFLFQLSTRDNSHSFLLCSHTPRHSQAKKKGNVKYII